MELQHNQATLDFWELAADFTATNEDHTEMIVPDHAPDIARILSAEGNVFVRSSEVCEGKATLSGIVQISVLYIPERSSAAQSLTYEVPFQMSEACPSECSQLQAIVHGDEISARLLNPRKVRLQYRLLANIRAYRFLSVAYTCGLEAEPRYALELQTQHETVNVVTVLGEKDFSYEDTLHLPQNRGAIASVLSVRAKSVIEDTKIIGTKAIVKGRYLTEFLVAYDGGSCENSSFELPFSHIADLNAPQDAFLSAELSLTKLTAEPVRNEDGGGELELFIESHLYLTVSERKELSFVTDLYSTAFEVAAETQELRFLDAAETQIRRQVWQDTLEIGIPAERVLLISAACGPVMQNGKDSQELRTALRIRALYLTEDGRILSAERSGETAVLCPEEVERLRCWASCGEEISSVMTADGMIVRVPVDFHLRPQTFRSLHFVSSASIEDSKQKDPAAQPSLVLRKKRKEEGLWPLAKRHNSTVRDILAANGCTAEEELPDDKMILIPRRRA